MAQIQTHLEKAEITRDLERILGADSFLIDDYDLQLYEYDGSMDRARPLAVALPSSAEQISALVRYCNERGIPYTARGAGTGLSGGAIPVQGGMLITFSRMNRILEIDAQNLCARVQPGVVNLRLTQEAASFRLAFAPDPSSQKACTIGGNVGENAGGPHTLLYGVTTNHVLGLEVVLPDGEAIQVGGPALDTPGYDLTGLLVGAEGTTGITTAATVHLTPIAEGVKTFLAIFKSVREASRAVSAVIAQGVIPAAMEMMDQTTIRAVEEVKKFGFPTDAGAVLLIEFEGLVDGLESLVDGVIEICRNNEAIDVRVARDAKERDLLWAGRKGAFGAFGRITPDYYTVDGVVPRGKITEVLDRILAIGEEHKLRIANVFHAGDGNLHPVIFFNIDDQDEMHHALEAGADILRACAEAGGSITGEHGIGIEKNECMPLIFSEIDIAVQRIIKQTFDPAGLCNPGKLFPTPGRCLEMRPGRMSLVGW